MDARDIPKQLINDTLMNELICQKLNIPVDGAFFYAWSDYETMPLQCFHMRMIMLPLKKNIDGPQFFHPKRRIAFAELDELANILRKEGLKVEIKADKEDAYGCTAPRFDITNTRTFILEKLAPKSLLDHIKKLYDENKKFKNKLAILRYTSSPIHHNKDDGKQKTEISNNSWLRKTI